MSDAHRALLIAQNSEHHAQILASYARFSGEPLEPEDALRTALEYAEAAAGFAIARDLEVDAVRRDGLLDQQRAAYDACFAWRDALLAHVNGAPLIAPKL